MGAPGLPGARSLRIGGLADIVGEDTLQSATIAEVYGASGIVDAPRQRVDQLSMALENLPHKTEVRIDLAEATFMSHRVLSGLGRLADTNVKVTIRGVSEAVHQLRTIVDPPKAHLRFECA